MKILFLLLILLPIFEITIFIIFLSFIGFLYSITEILVTFIIGCYLFSKNKNNLYDYEDSKLNLFNLNKHIFKNKRFSFFNLIGCVLLIFPGYISDFFGILLMLQPIQLFIIKYAISVFKNPLEKNNFYNNGTTETIEGEFYDLHNDKRNISKK